MRPSFSPPALAGGGLPGRHLCHVPELPPCLDHILQLLRCIAPQCNHARRKQKKNWCCVSSAVGRECDGERLACFAKIYGWPWCTVNLSCRLPASSFLLFLWSWWETHLTGDGFLSDDGLALWILRAPSSPSPLCRRDVALVRVAQAQHSTGRACCHRRKHDDEMRRVQRPLSSPPHPRAQRHTHEKQD
ncbi:hypothetical protein BC567DRAFT_74095 [Phyllosticta citribraziliensis]